MLGERLYPLIAILEPERAGKITGMLLELNDNELFELLMPQDMSAGAAAVRDNVAEARQVLLEFEQQEAAEGGGPSPPPSPPGGSEIGGSSEPPSPPPSPPPEGYGPPDAGSIPPPSWSARTSGTTSVTTPGLGDDSAFPGLPGSAPAGRGRGGGGKGAGGKGGGKGKGESGKGSKGGKGKGEPASNGDLSAEEADAVRVFRECGPSVCNVMTAEVYQVLQGDPFFGGRYSVSELEQRNVR